MPKTYNFYEFLKTATNQSLSFLQDNPQYDDVLRALADMFEKLYLRVQEIKITNSMDITASNNFQKYLNTNDGTVVVDFVLDHVAKYLDTDHFKDTVALLIRQYRERELGSEIPDIDEFIKNEVIPPFKFFTLNAGDLHKSKGVRGLIERIFEFYSPATTYEKMFDGVKEWDREDPLDKRLEKFTSYRVGITSELLTENYPALSNLIVYDYIECSRHKLARAGNYIFISKKEREDWYIVDEGKNLFKIDDDFFAVWQGTSLLFYRDNIEIYDSSYTYVTPTPFETYENVEWVPQVINIKDPLNQYQNHNLYFVEKVSNADTFSDYEYNLIRFYADQFRDRQVFQTIRRGLGISYDPLSYVDRVEYPKITQYVSMDYLWIDLYDIDQTTEYTFDKEDTKIVYSYVMDYQTKQPDGLGGFTFPIDRVLVVARDGYNYEPSVNGFSYQIIDKLSNETYDKYMFQERVMTSLVEEELKRSVSSNVTDVKTVFDLFIPNSYTNSEDNFYNFKGYWNASSDSAPSLSPNHGDYWIVSVRGSYNLTGNPNWDVNDVVVWNGNFGYWEKNNDITTFTDDVSTIYKLDRMLVVLNEPEFDFVDENDSSIITPYEKSCGLFFIRLSDIILDISGFNKILSVDVNSIETFGENPFVMISYQSATDNRIKFLMVPMDKFTREVIIADVSRILLKYPYKNSVLSIYNIIFTDKHILVFASDSKHTDMGRFVIIMENTGYNVPLGLRSNVMNVQYDVDLRNLTRQNQEFFREEDENGDEIDDEEVAAFKATLSRYTPINTDSEYLAALIDIGYTGQSIESEATPETITVTINELGDTKTLKEQSVIKMQDSLVLRVDGDPTDVNCDCRRQREILYVTEFDAMTIFYDIFNRIPDPNLIDVPTKIAVNKLGETNDIYSKSKDVCRWESNWFEYLYDDGDTFPMQVRTKIRVNLYDLYQSFIPWGGNGPLEYNWGIHFKVQYLPTRDINTITDWIDAIDEEIYKPIVEFDECNPIGQFYTTDLIDDGSTFPLVIIDDGSTILKTEPAEPKPPWEVYDIPAAKISLV